MSKEWERYAGKHLNPQTHNEESLHRFLRSEGVLRGAHAFNMPPAHVPSMHMISTPYTALKNVRFNEDLEQDLSRWVGGLPKHCGS